MRKTVIYSQRVEIKEAYQERWDCADQKIPGFLWECGYLPVPVPNVPHIGTEYIKRLEPTGILLTGGNSLVKYGGNAPERDLTDRLLIKVALEYDIPIYAFCRGMQSLLDYFENELENTEGHVAVRHNISGEIDACVNSYHKQALRNINPPFTVLARADDGIIEAVSYPEKKFIATMWHPEREDPFNENDKIRVRELFG